jgi:hypothetical protein
MKKQIASLAVILLAVSSLSFYGCGDENEGNIGAEDPEDTGEDVGGEDDEAEGGNAEVGESGEASGEDE